MDTPAPSTAVEPRWRFYLRATAFLLPALAVWAFAVQSLCPRVRLIWREGGGAAPDSQWLMDGVGLLVGYGWVPAVSLLAAVVGSGVLALNAGVLAGVTAMCLLLTLAPPGLMRG